MSSRSTKRYFKSPENNKWFNAALARASRRVWYQELLFRRLRAIGPTKKRSRGEQWRQAYVELLERAARHERFIESADSKFLNWIFTQQRHVKPLLRIVRGGKS